MTLLKELTTFVSSLEQPFSFYELGRVESLGISAIEMADALGLIGPTSKLVRLRAFDSKGSATETREIHIVLAFPNLPRGPKKIDESAFFELGNLLGSRLATQLDWDLAPPSALSMHAFKKHFLPHVTSLHLTRHSLMLADQSIPVVCLIGEFERVRTH